MSIKDEKLIVEVLDQERSLQGLFKVHEEFHHVDSSRGEIVVPAGYVTDFASIPYPCRWLIPATGHCAKASLLHDYLLARGKDNTERRSATGVFNRALREAGCGPIRRVMMVAFVAVLTYPQLYLFKQENG